jgi:hypothetical protein
MSGILGILYRDGAPVAPATIETMRTAMCDWARDGGDVWLDGCAGLGQSRTFATLEAQFEHFPRIDNNIVFTVAGRVDNRAELISDLGFKIDDLDGVNPKSEIRNLKFPTAIYSSTRTANGVRIASNASTAIGRLPRIIPPSADCFWHAIISVTRRYTITPMRACSPSPRTAAPCSR